MKNSLARSALLSGMVIVATLCTLAASPQSALLNPGPPYNCPAATGTTQTIDPPMPAAPNDFQVIYAGIVTHAQIIKSINRVNEYRRRAIIIQGNTIHKRHQPLLGVYRADVASLHNAAGQAVQFCDHYYCWVRIRGIRMRVVDEVETDGNVAPVEITGSVGEDPSFTCLVPKLRDEAGGGELHEVLKKESLPPPPADGYMDMAGGTLSACPFRAEAQFSPDANKQGCRQFAEVVFWSGHTAHRARLQIKSNLTGSHWVTVKLQDDTIPLKVAIANLGTEHHTSSHFALNEKLVANTLPTIDKTNCQECKPSANHDCYLCGTVGLNDIAGCSNSQWP